MEREDRPVTDSPETDVSAPEAPVPVPVSAPDVPMRACQGCGALLARTTWALDRDLHASPECWHAYGQVTTFATQYPELVALHQVTLDTYGAQHPGSPTAPIFVAYSLAGLYLALDVKLDPPAVRTVHQRMGKPQPWWPDFSTPPARSALTIADVLREGAGAGSVTGHAAAVQRWSGDVWRSWAPRHDDVAGLLDRLFPGEFSDGDVDGSGDDLA